MVWSAKVALICVTHSQGYVRPFGGVLTAGTVAYAELGTWEIIKLYGAVSGALWQCFSTAEKLLPSSEDRDTVLQLLASSASGALFGGWARLFVVVPLGRGTSGTDKALLKAASPHLCACSSR